MYVKRHRHSISRSRRCSQQNYKSTLQPNQCEVRQNYSPFIQSQSECRKYNLVCFNCLQENFSCKKLEISRTLRQEQKNIWLFESKLITLMWSSLPQSTAAPPPTYICTVFRDFGSGEFWKRRLKGTWNRNNFSRWHRRWRRPAYCRWSI